MVVFDPRRLVLDFVFEAPDLRTSFVSCLVAVFASTNSKPAPARPNLKTEESAKNIPQVGDSMLVPLIVVSLLFWLTDLWTYNAARVSQYAADLAPIVLTGLRFRRIRRLWSRILWNAALHDRPRLPPLSDILSNVPQYDLRRDNQSLRLPPIQAARSYRHQPYPKIHGFPERYASHIPLFKPETSPISFSRFSIGTTESEPDHTGNDGSLSESDDESSSDVDSSNTDEDDVARHAHLTKADITRCHKAKLATLSRLGFNPETRYLAYVKKTHKIGQSGKLWACGFVLPDGTKCGKMFCKQSLKRHIVGEHWHVRNLPYKSTFIVNWELRT
ncbi:hypothetical protein CPC08DRAFT_788388 [Agrocybe pediades]|nr:hypothetical protein CPC08DRAFT_788388 [Agrocybe pediades]